MLFKFIVRERVEKYFCSSFIKYVEADSATIATAIIERSYVVDEVKLLTEDLVIRN
jgi:hypothetical protein